MVTIAKRAAVVSAVMCARNPDPGSAEPCQQARPRTQRHPPAAACPRGDVDGPSHGRDEPQLCAGVCRDGL